MKSFARHHTGFFVAAGLFLLGVSHAALATPPEAFTFTNINSDGILNSPANVQTSAAVVGGFALRRIDVSGTLTSVNASTWRTDSRILVTAPGGATAVFQPFLTGSVYTSLSFNTTITMPGVTDPAGVWSFRFFETLDDGGPGNIDARWTLTFSFTDQLPAPPAATDLGDILQPGATQQISVGVNEIRWFTFVLPRTIGALRGTYLDIDTIGSTIAAPQGSGLFPDDTEIGLYNASGDLISDSDDEGLGYTSALSFGAGTRPGSGDGLPFNGRDGTLTPGRYYLAVGAHNLNFLPRVWGVSANGNQNGTVRVNFTTNVPAGPACLAEFNGDGAANSQDFFDFLVAFFSNDIQTDVNLDGIVNSQDFFDFLTAFFVGC